MRAGRRRGTDPSDGCPPPHLRLPPHQLFVRVLRAGAGQCLAVLAQRQVAVVQRDGGLAQAVGVGGAFGGLRGCPLGGEGERQEMWGRPQCPSSNLRYPGPNASWKRQTFPSSPSRPERGRWGSGPPGSSSRRQQFSGRDALGKARLLLRSAHRMAVSPRARRAEKHPAQCLALTRSSAKCVCACWCCRFRYSLRQGAASHTGEELLSGDQSPP